MNEARDRTMTGSLLASDTDAQSTAARLSAHGEILQCGARGIKLEDEFNGMNVTKKSVVEGVALGSAKTDIGGARYSRSRYQYRQA